MAVHPQDDVAHNILNERRGPVDRNPTLECDGCGRTEQYQTIKVSDEWQTPNEPGDPLLCPDCDQARPSVEERAENNEQLSRFASNSGAEQ